MMTGGGPGTQTYTASFYLYQVGFQQFHLSQATAGSWMFLVAASPIVITFLVRRLLKRGNAMTASVARRGQRRVGACRCVRDLPSWPSSWFSCWCRSTGWSSRPSSRSSDYMAVPPVWFPAEADSAALYRRALRLSRAAGADQQPHHLLGDDRALGAARDDDGLQPGALQYRRAASRLLGAVAALPAAGRDRPAALPALSLPRPERHVFRPVLAYTVFTLPRRRCG